MVKLALPKGRLQARTAAVLEQASLGITAYSANSRNYRLVSEVFPGLAAKIFQERDVAIQVAIGNYDLGICGFNWVEELITRFPASDIVVIKGLGYGRGKLCVAAHRRLGISSPRDLSSLNRVIALASENPNLAEAYAARLRLPRFTVFPVWGAAEVYPSFAADLAIFYPSSPDDLDRNGLLHLDSISSREAFLIANKRSWETVDLGQVLDLLCRSEVGGEPGEDGMSCVPPPASGISFPTSYLSPLTSCIPLHASSDTVRIALPDGHQQKHTAALLDRAAVTVSGYNSPPAECPLEVKCQGVVVKVIRPQDMPLQVANGNIDLAVTGRDWLRDHLCAFPSSPVVELLDLKFGRVRLVAVVPNGATAPQLQEMGSMNSRGRVIRVASEYTNIADKYCRDKRLGHYKVIPTWGATEAFLPEDADLLIENTETGETLARNNLKVVDTVFESSGCLIGSALPVQSESKRARIAYIIETLSKAV